MYILYVSENVNKYRNDICQSMMKHITDRDRESVSVSARISSDVKEFQRLNDIGYLIC